jgi:hypothetical protein
MADAAMTDVARERDSAMQRFQVLAAEIRAHEEAVRRSIASPKRPADDRLYRALRRVKSRSSCTEAASSRRRRSR